MPRLLFLLILIILALPASAQYTTTLRGTVTDKDGKSPLQGATVSVVNTPLGAVTDSLGRFRITGVPVGRQSLQLSFAGYEPLSLDNLLLSTGKELVLNLELQETVNSLSKVTVSGTPDKTHTLNEMTSNSGNSFVNEQTSRYAGSRQDPSRMVANYAGVYGSNDQRNDVIVRGNSPLGVLWRLDDVDIPSPNHFSGQGASGGALSMLNNFLLDRSDFLTGAFPAEYGNKMSAVFDLHLKSGNNEKFEMASQFGINGLELTAEGPLSRKHNSSFLVSYRYSTFAIFNAVGIHFGVGGIPTYQDATMKWTFRTGKRSTLSFFALGGISDLAVLDSKKDSSDWTFTRAGEDVHYGYSMGVAGLSLNYFFNHNTSLKNVLSYNTNLISIKVDSVSRYVSDQWLRFENNSLEGTLALSQLFNKKLNTHHLLRAGLTNSLLRFNYREHHWQHNLDSMVDVLRSKGSTFLTQAWVEWQWRLSSRLTLNSGVHYQYFFLNHTQNVEPRFGVVYELGPKQTVSLAYGMLSQIQPLVLYYLQQFDTATGRYYSTNRNLEASRAQHLVLGTDWKPWHDFHVKAEAYYQDLYHIPVKQNVLNGYSAINLGGDFNFPNIDSLQNTGTGTNYGAELTLEKFFSHSGSLRNYFLVTGSLYSSKYKGSDGIERHTKFGGGYMLTTLAGIEFPFGRKAKNFISLDERTSWVAGNYYTPIDLNESILQHRQVNVAGEEFSLKNPDYLRFDLKLSYTINYKKVNQSLSVVVENIFGRKNVLDYLYDDTSQSLKTEYQLGRFPYGAYRIEF